MRGGVHREEAGGGWNLFRTDRDFLQSPNGCLIGSDEPNTGFFGQDDKTPQPKALTTDSEAFARPQAAQGGASGVNLNSEGEDAIARAPALETQRPALL